MSPARTKKGVRSPEWTPLSQPKVLPHAFVQTGEDIKLYLLACQAFLQELKLSRTN
jgi:hypothetical protein